MIGIYEPLPEVVIVQPFFGVLLTLCREQHIFSD